MMLLLNFIVWRRDVAARKLCWARSKVYRSSREDRRTDILAQRTERWTRLMLVQQRRLGICETE